MSFLEVLFNMLLGLYLSMPVILIFLLPLKQFCRADWNFIFNERWNIPVLLLVCYIKVSSLDAYQDSVECSMVVIMLICILISFYTLYFLRNHNPTWLLVGMLATAFLLMIGFATVFMLINLRVEDYFYTSANTWFGGSEKQVSYWLLVERFVSYVYMGIFVSLCVKILGDNLQKKS